MVPRTMHSTVSALRSRTTLRRAVVSLYPYTNVAAERKRVDGSREESRIGALDRRESMKSYFTSSTKDLPLPLYNLLTQTPITDTWRKASI